MSAGDTFASTCFGRIFVTATPVRKFGDGAISVISILSARAFAPPLGAAELVEGDDGVHATRAAKAAAPPLSSRNCRLVSLRVVLSSFFAIPVILPARTRSHLGETPRFKG